MKWPAKYTEVEPLAGTTRLKRVFAWVPTYIAGTKVWLEYYEILQVCRIIEEKVTIEGKEVIFLVNKWINLAKRCK